MAIYIPERFQVAVDEHLVLNMVGVEDWPLILGIFGRPGDGKSFQARAHLGDRGVRVVSINAAGLESDRAGQPGKMVLAAYREAGERTESGRPSALLIDDFDTTVGEWAHSTGTVNHQQVLAQLMHLADSPTQAGDETLRRIPVFVTGNDLTKIYPPLRRPGRLRPLTWIPTEDERARTVATILADLADKEAVTKILAACPDASISFFAELRTTIVARRAGDAINDLAPKLVDVIKDPDRYRRALLGHLHKDRLGQGDLVELATTEWALRQDAAVSHLPEGGRG